MLRQSYQFVAGRSRSLIDTRSVLLLLALGMRIFVKRAGKDSQVIPCKDATVLVEKLKETVVKRLCGSEEYAEGYRLVLAGTGSVVAEKDVVEDVLQDGDCLLLRGR